MKLVNNADITSNLKDITNCLNGRNWPGYFSFFTDANNTVKPAQIVTQKSNTAVCFKGKRNNSGVSGKGTLVRNNKHTQCMAALSQCICAHITDQMAHQSNKERSKNWTEDTSCFIIPRLWAQNGSLFWYTAWNHTSNCIKHSNNLVLSHVWCQSQTCCSVLVLEKNINASLYSRNGMSYTV